MRELYEADFHKPGIYGSGRVWAIAWDLFRRTPSRGGRGRRAAVDFVLCFGCGGISCFFRFFLSERTRPAASMWPPSLIYLSTRNSTAVRSSSEVDVYTTWYVVFALQAGSSIKPKIPPESNVHAVFES